MQGKSDKAIQSGAAVYSPRVLRLYDLWVLEFSNRYAWMCHTGTVLLPFFQRHLSKNHLDVGVGTGYYLAHSAFPPEQKITLLDLNPNSLESARARISHLRPSLIQEDVLHPGSALDGRKFDSISLFYLLHCLPGDMTAKATTTFDLLRRHLNVNGVLYGATILGDEAQHNWLGRRLMRLYNEKGIFGNRHDTLQALTAALSRHFVDVNVRQHGKVALFSAQLRGSADSKIA